MTELEKGRYMYLTAILIIVWCLNVFITYISEFTLWFKVFGSCVLFYTLFQLICRFCENESIWKEDN